MLSSTYTVAWGNPLLVAGGISAYYYYHVGAPVHVQTIAVVVNGTTINSAADAVVTFNRLRGGVSSAIGTVNLPTGTAAGSGASSTIVSPVELLPGDRIEAKVTTLATIAGGTVTATAGLLNG